MKKEIRASVAAFAAGFAGFYIGALTSIAWLSYTLGIVSAIGAGLVGYYFDELIKSIVEVNEYRRELKTPGTLAYRQVRTFDAITRRLDMQLARQLVIVRVFYAYLFGIALCVLLKSVSSGLMWADAVMMSGVLTLILFGLSYVWMEKPGKALGHSFWRKAITRGLGVNPEGVMYWWRYRHLQRGIVDITEIENRARLYLYSQYKRLGPDAFERKFGQAQQRFLVETVLYRVLGVHVRGLINLVGSVALLVPGVILVPVRIAQGLIAIGRKAVNDQAPWPILAIAVTVVVVMLWALGAYDLTPMARFGWSMASGMISLAAYVAFRPFIERWLASPKATLIAETPIGKVELVPVVWAYHFYRDVRAGIKRAKRRLAPTVRVQLA